MRSLSFLCRGGTACQHGSEIPIEGPESQIAVIFFLIDIAGDIPFHMKKGQKTQATTKTIAHQSSKN